MFLAILGALVAPTSAWAGTASPAKPLAPSPPPADPQASSLSLIRSFGLEGSAAFAFAPSAPLRASVFTPRSESASLLFLSPLSPLRAVLRVAAEEVRASLNTTVQAAEAEPGPVDAPLTPVAQSEGAAADRRAAALRHRRRSVLNERDRDRLALDVHAAPERAYELDPSGLSGHVQVVSLSSDAPAPGAGRTATNAEPSGWGGRIPDGAGSLELKGRITDALAFTITGLAAESASTTWRAGAEFDLELDEHRLSIGAAYGTRFQSSAAGAQNQVDRRSVGAVSLMHDADLARAISVSWGGKLQRADFLRSSNAGTTRFDPRLAVFVAFDEVNYLRLDGSGDTLFPGQEVIAGDGGAIALSEGLPVLSRGFEAQRTWRADAVLGRAVGEWRVEARGRREFVRSGLVVTPSILAGAPYVQNSSRPDAIEVAFLAERTFADTQAQASVEYGYGRFSIPATGFDPVSYHRLTARLDAYLRRTGTALVAFHRTHEGAPVARRGVSSERAREHRYLIELRQDVPWVPAFVRADMALLVGLRNVYYDDVDRRALDEFAVLRPPRRVTGGIRVQF
jgi:hypothetical protein